MGQGKAGDPPVSDYIKLCDRADLSGSCEVQGDAQSYDFWKIDFFFLIK